MTLPTATRPFPGNARVMSRIREAVDRCEQFAETNHGVIPRRVAVAEGLDDSAISRLTRSGTWTRLAPRAFGVRGAPVTWRSRLAAVQGHLESDFLFSHRTAGTLHQLDGVPEGHLEIITNRSITLADVTVHRLRSALPRIVHIDGMPVSNGTRTVLDLFAVLPSTSAELALEDALRRKITTIERLWDEYESLCRPGRNGCKPFRRALLTRDHRDGTLQSRMEAKLRRVVNRLPGGRPLPQVRAETGDSTYFIDFAFPDIKLGIEAHSIRWHMGEAKWYYDMRRDRALKRVGWTLLYYGMDDLLRTDAVRDEIVAIRESLKARLF